MDPAERAEIERACARLVALYCHYVDHGEAARIADLFAKDGVWRSAERTLEGTEELRRAFGLRQANGRRTSRHVCNNLVVDVIDSDHARGCVYLTLYRHDGDEDQRIAPLSGPLLVGEYRDRFVRTPDGWRFAEREAEVSFLAPTREGGVPA